MKDGEKMTEQEAKKKGMSDIDIALGIVTGEIEADPNKKTPMEKIHGEIVRVVQEAYGDCIIYEDGYEEWNSIGD